MSIRDDLITRIATDYQYFDGVEELSVYRPSTDTTYTGVKAVNISADSKEIAGILKLKKADKAFRIFADTLSVEPSPGDVITESDESATWTVMACGTRRMKAQGIAYYVGCIQRIAT